MPFYYGPESTSFTLEDGPTGGLQLDVQPWRAAVFVDGVYAGRVDDYSGYYKHLELVAGSHQIVVVESGYRPLVIDAYRRARQDDDLSRHVEQRVALVAAYR